MKKSNWIIIALLFVLVAAVSSCDDRDTKPQHIFIWDQPLDGGGDDDEDPIIIGDTTLVNPHQMGSQ